MPTIPLALKLRRSVHRKIAEAQDLMVLGTFEVLPAAVIHGGTAIWRCYGGNRFSEDVDFYLPPSARGKAAALSTGFRRRGLPEQELKETSGSVFAKFGPGALAVRFEATFRKPEGVVVRRYEMVDGSFAAVRTLTAESLLQEKALAYLGRKKARDLYDVFFLVHIAHGGAPAREAVLRLLTDFKPPPDEAALRSTIITASVPTAADMKEAIARWAK
ncbi:MAG: nucleotidyl transferase AbiEii/AbiGii toxin family protein [Thaumarchaeota archaeon]|nr:nucleotidyl transferase AbiEii/AbiGii toxin family protein [Nitrososphaerota archaeon]